MQTQKLMQPQLLKHYIYLELLTKQVDRNENKKKVGVISKREGVIFSKVPN